MSIPTPTLVDQSNFLPDIHYQQLWEFPAWYWWHRHRIRLVIDQLELQELRHQDLCDLGGGGGGTLRQIVKGIRRSPRLRQHLKHFLLLDHDTRVGSHHLAQEGISWQWFDLNRPDAREIGNFLLLDVLEHLDDPDDFCQWLFHSTQSGGIGIVTVPAFRRLWSNWDVQLGHRTRFTLGQLERILQNAGFSVLFGSYFFSWTLVPAFFRKFWSSDNTGFPDVPPWLNMAMDRLGCWEAALLRESLRIPLGTSAMAVVRK